MDFALELFDDFFNRQINHPPPLLKNILEKMNKRLNSISSSKNVFDAAIPPYQKALDESAYTCKLTYNPEPAQKAQQKSPKKSDMMQPHEDQLRKKIPKYRRQMLPEKSPITQDL